MRTFFFALVGILVINLSEPAEAIHFKNIYETDTTSYVVIGAFAIQNNAVAFTSQANEAVAAWNLSAQFKLNDNCNLYYVYVLTTDNTERALQEAKRLRTETKFSDTWVYKGSFSKITESKNIDINPVTNDSISVVPVNETAVDFSKLERTITNEPVDHTFLFKLYKAADGEEVEGDIEVIAVERSKKLGTYKGNETVKLSNASRSGKLSLICNVFGYKKMQREYDFNKPAGDGITIDENNTVIVPFELLRLQKGDIAVMYNVFFFKDAGVMRPESRLEVNNLLKMLKENLNYKIKLHGHSNGGAPGKIIKMGDTKNFFSLVGTSESVGSAKMLSEQRAKIIKAYLVYNGIEESRILIKAWGGKRPIHNKNSNRAQENVRVEVEILEN